MGERCVRNAEVRGSIPLSSMFEGCSHSAVCILDSAVCILLPRGVTGNTSDSGSEESGFDPWRGNYMSDNGLTVVTHCFIDVSLGTYLGICDKFLVI